MMQHAIGLKDKSPSNFLMTIKQTHITNQKAQNVFRSSLPPSWLIREQHPDFHIDYYVEINCNGEVTDAQRGAYEVSRGQGKLSKDGGKIKVSIEVKGKYTKNKGKTDNIKFKLDGKTNFDPDAQNPLFPAAEPL